MTACCVVLFGSLAFIGSPVVQVSHGKMDAERLQNEASALLGPGSGEVVHLVKGPGLSAFSTSLNLIKMALGSGVLTLPYGVLFLAKPASSNSHHNHMTRVANNTLRYPAFSQAGILGGVCW